MDLAKFRSSWRGVLSAALYGLLWCIPVNYASAADLTVFAASSLTDALTEVEKTYESSTGHSAAISFAASSALARQIEASGGADIFLSADTDWVDYLDNRGLLAARKNLLGNALVLIAPKSSTLALTIGPHFDIVGALHGGRLAIADPASVPAGKYGRDALSALGVWDGVAGHLAPAENVRVALAYVARGEAPLGIVYATDAAADPNVRILGAFPADTHPAIIYPAAITKDAKPLARGFLEFLSSPRAADIFRKFGFSMIAD